MVIKSQAPGRWVAAGAVAPMTKFPKQPQIQMNATNKPPRVLQNQANKRGHKIPLGEGEGK